MGICCSKAAAGRELDDDDHGSGFPWMHDDVFHGHLWASAGVSVHTKQGWKGANQDAMTVSQVHVHCITSLFSASTFTFTFTLDWFGWLQTLSLLL